MLISTWDRNDPLPGHNTTYDPPTVTSSVFAAANLLAAPGCAGPVQSQPKTFWLDQQDHTGSARGYAPFISGYYTYPVYRNVLDYSVRNDGTGDQTANLQNAIYTDGRGGSRKGQGVTYE